MVEHILQYFETTCYHFRAAPVQVNTPEIKAALQLTAQLLYARYGKVITADETGPVVVARNNLNSRKQICLQISLTRLINVYMADNVTYRLIVCS